MENEMNKIDLPFRFFKVRDKVWHGGLMIVNPGEEITLANGNKNRVGRKSIIPDQFGVLKTNDPEIIFFIKHKNTPSFEDEKGQINELFIGRSKLDLDVIADFGKTYAEMYLKCSDDREDILKSIEKHKAEVGEAIKNKYFDYHPNISLFSKEAALAQKERILSIAEKEADLIIREEAVVEKQKQAEEIKVKKKSKQQ
jgi:hypothetical protein